MPRILNELSLRKKTTSLLYTWMAMLTLSCPNLGLNYISDLKNNDFKGWEEKLIERLVSNTNLTWSKAPLKTCCENLRKGLWSPLFGVGS